jgi:hypothetical protein
MELGVHVLPPTRKRNKRKKKKNQTTKDKRQVFPTKAGLQRGPLQLSREALFFFFLRL